MDSPDIWEQVFALHGSLWRVARRLRGHPRCPSAPIKDLALELSELLAGSSTLEQRDLAEVFAWARQVLEGSPIPPAVLEGEPELVRLLVDSREPN
ncbi:MAG: hypothetical protein AAGF12_07720 [Myxococcota bacterium]